MKINKTQTHYKTFHKGFTKDRGKGMTRGDVANQLGNIKAQVFKWDNDILITVRNLKEILSGCRYYVSESTIRRMTNEGALKGRKFYHMWFYTKEDLYDWVDYLVAVGLSLLRKRGLIKEEKDLDVLIGSRGKPNKK